METQQILGHLAGVPVVQLTQERIGLDSREDHLHYYSIRQDDSGDPCSIEKAVLVNHFGTLVTMRPIQYLETDNEDNSKDMILSDDAIGFIYSHLY